MGAAAPACLMGTSGPPGRPSSIPASHEVCDRDKSPLRASAASSPRGARQASPSRCPPGDPEAVEQSRCPQRGLELTYPWGCPLRLTLDSPVYLSGSPVSRVGTFMGEPGQAGASQQQEAAESGAV